MRPDHWQIYRYRLPLKQPIRARGATISFREGLLLELISKNGHRGLGEVAPLPGVHQSDWEHCLAELVAQLPRFMQQTWASPGADPVSWASRHSHFFPAPVVRYGVEMALLNLLAAARNSSLLNLLSNSEPTPETLPVNGIVMGDEAQMLARATELIQAGYATLKIKVARLPLAREVQLLKRLREMAPPSLVLRLDANRGWTLAQAMAFGQQLGPRQIEYLEEPVQGGGQEEAFFRATGIPVAWDETLDQGSVPSACPSAVRAWVLKPSALGSFSVLRQRIQQARNTGRLPVISSAFESGVGIGALAQVAAAWAGSGVTAGLATLDLFAEDVLENPFPLRRGKIFLGELPTGRPALRHEVLLPLAQGGR